MVLGSIFPFFLFWWVQIQCLYFVQSKGRVCVRREEKGFPLVFALTWHSCWKTHGWTPTENQLCAAGPFIPQRLSANIQRRILIWIQFFFLFALIHMHMKLPSITPALQLGRPGWISNRSSHYSAAKCLKAEAAARKLSKKMMHSRLFSEYSCDFLHISWKKAHYLLK